MSILTMNIFLTISCITLFHFRIAMEAIPASDLVHVTGKILCCQCGTPIDPNPANLCVACLRTQVDITEGIPKQVMNQNKLYFFD